MKSKLMGLPVMQTMNLQIGSQEDLHNPDYMYEPKLDGIRALCYINDNDVRLISRNAIDITKKFAHIDIRSHARARSCILDGELIAYDTHNRPDFNALKKGSQVHYIVFDILFKDGKDLTGLPLLQRKKILEDTLADGPHIEKIVYTHDGVSLWDEMVKRKWEGVVAKRADSAYYAGKRAAVWLKIKIFQSVDCLIIGFTQSKRKISALLLGLYNADKSIRFIGKVGTGFDAAMINELYERLAPLEIKTPHVAHVKEEAMIHWVKVRYVAEIKFVEFTPHGILRTPSFIRLRHDKKPNQATVADQAPFLK